MNNDTNSISPQSELKKDTEKIVSKATQKKIKIILLLLLVLFGGSLLAAKIEFLKQSPNSLKLYNPVISVSPTPSTNETSSTRSYQTFIAQGYGFVWNQQTGETKLTTPQGNQLTFTINKKPLYAVLHKLTQTLALVVGNEGVPEKSETLYVVKNNQVHKVYDGGAEKDIYTENTLIYPSLYDFENRTSPFTWIQFSPDGTLLFASVTVFEGVEPVIIDVPSLHVVFDGRNKDAIYRQTLWYGRTFFSPSSSCWINLVPIGVRGPDITIGKGKDFISLRNEIPEKIEILDNGSSQVLWNDNCSGVIFLKANTSDDETSLQFGFSYPNKNITLFTPDTLPQNLVQSASNNSEVVYSVTLN